MCLTVLEKKFEIAKGDMVVWKLIYDIDDASFYQNFRYTPNTMYKIEKNLVIDSYDTVSDGFHAYTRVSFLCLNYYKRFSIKLVKFIIPRGATYIRGDNNDIVSNMIQSGSLKDCWLRRMLLSYCVR